MEREFPSSMSAESDFPAVAQSASFEAALMQLSALLASALAGSAVPLGVVGPVAVGLVAFRLRAYGGPRSRLPNAVTAIRALLIAALALWARHIDSLAVPATIVLVFALDGVDGYLARRFRAASQQGARFDLETDGFLVLTICTLLFVNGLPGWVLLGGTLRYVYVIANALLPSRGNVPRSRLGRYAFSGALGLFVAALLLPGDVRSVLAALGTAVLCASFSRSFFWSFAKG